MHISIRHTIFLAALSVYGSAALLARTPQDHQHPAEGGAHHHPQAAKLKNEVPADAASIAAGQAVYQKQCAGCHGDTGKGDGKMGAELTPKPSNLADADWKHGSTDGEIFTVIRDGVKTTAMRPYGKKLTTHQLWDVVNYVRSIGPKTGTH
jgi:cbb3-type cytochrome c oxidase subunit III